MASVEKYFPKMLAYEGGYVNDPKDHGGATNMGVTIGTWKAMGYDKNGDRIINEVDIMLLTKDDAMKVLKRGYWDKWKADLIANQSIAEQLVDWVWCSGAWGIKIPQKILGTTSDGVVGQVTLNILNNTDQAKFHADVQKARLDFIDNIIKNHPDQAKFEKGWKKRVTSFKYSAA